MAFVVAVLLVVAAIVAVAVSESADVRAGAVGVLGIAGIALAAYLLAVLNRTGVTVDRGGGPGAPTMELGAGVDGDRLHEALVTALRDVHALQRGTRHVADTAAGLIRSRSDVTTAATAVIDLFETQRDRAAAHEQRLEERLHVLGTHPSRGTDDEAIIAALLYERLLVRGVATNARHAFGLASLSAATYTLIEHLAAVAGDEPTRSLAEQCRREIESLAQRWTNSWDTVLGLDANDDRHDAMLALLEEAHAMETMRASLLAVTARQARAAGMAAGPEDAGLAHPVALVDQERSGAANDRDLLRHRLEAFGRHSSPAHAFETFAAARAMALVEQIRSYKLVRDIRDLLAADQTRDRHLRPPVTRRRTRRRSRHRKPRAAARRERAHRGRPPHRRTRRRAGDRAPSRVTASPDTACMVDWLERGYPVEREPAKV